MPLEVIYYDFKVFRAINLNPITIACQNKAEKCIRDEKNNLDHTPVRFDGIIFSKLILHGEKLEPRSAA